MDIVKAFPLLMEQEGIQLTNVAGDRGGLTKFGIAKSSHPNVDIANLTADQAKDIYLNDYWVPSRCGQLKTELMYMHFSCAVNCGVGSAIKILQRASRVADDGVCGPATIGASQSISIQDYGIEWFTHYKAIIESEKSKIIAGKGEAEYSRLLAANETQQKFMNGWQHRIDTILAWYKAGQLS